MGASAEKVYAEVMAYVTGHGGQISMASADVGSQGHDGMGH